MRSEELDYQRALQAYLWAVPMVNAIEFWRALIDAGVSPTEPSLLVFDRLGRVLTYMTSELGAEPLTFAEFHARFTGERATSGHAVPA